jgi:hypothetical protein
MGSEDKIAVSAKTRLGFLLNFSNLWRTSPQMNCTGGILRNTMYNGTSFSAPNVYMRKYVQCSSIYF